MFPTIIILNNIENYRSNILFIQIFNVFILNRKMYFNFYELRLLIIECQFFQLRNKFNYIEHAQNIDMTTQYSL